MPLLYLIVLILVPAMLVFMFWRAAFHMRRDRLRGQRGGRRRPRREPGRGTDDGG
ncbi:hypothetical protein [Sphingomonas parva]|uniref:hypothetical protein n=1 Tax=Sphingomonas parva TaxID=2555898 RepID=UPI00142FEE0E|nr:hypothetical protein [Sphingomonas parva]